VQILEEKVESLEKLPARMEALALRILQFREEVRAEFSATREGLLHEEVIARSATIGEGGRSRSAELVLEYLASREEVELQIVLGGAD